MSFQRIFTHEKVQGEKKSVKETTTWIQTHANGAVGRHLHPSPTFVVCSAVYSLVYVAFRVCSVCFRSEEGERKYTERPPPQLRGKENDQ